MACEAKPSLHWTSPDKLEDLGGLYCSRCKQSLFTDWRPYNCHVKIKEREEQKHG